MNEKNIVRSCMQIRGTTQEELAQKTGFQYQSNITGIINRGTSMRVDNFVKLLDALRYDVVVIDRDTGEVFSEIDPPEYEPRKP